MGFYEDDRIRSKNRVHQDAWDTVENFRFMRYSEDHIRRFAKLGLSCTTNPYRNNVYRAMLQIVGSDDEKGNSRTTVTDE